MDPITIAMMAYQAYQSKKAANNQPAGAMLPINNGSINNNQAQGLQQPDLGASSQMGAIPTFAMQLLSNLKKKQQMQYPTSEPTKQLVPWGMNPNQAGSMV